MIFASVPRPRCLEPSTPLMPPTSPKNPWHCFQRCLTSARRPPVLVVEPHRCPVVPAASALLLLLQRGCGWSSTLPAGGFHVNLALNSGGTGLLSYYFGSEFSKISLFGSSV